MSDTAVAYLADPLIHERLRIARLRARLEQAEIASKLGVSRPTVSAWENGKSEPKATQAAQWAEITGCPVEWLVRSRCFSLVKSSLGQMELALDLGDPTLRIVN